MVDDLSRADAQLLANIKRDLDSLTSLAVEVKDEWCEGDLVYRFWHQSFKVYGIQDRTLRIVRALEAIAPEDCELDERFQQIIAEGTGKTLEYEHNERWLAETRPMLEAFWHAEKASDGGPSRAVARPGAQPPPLRAGRPCCTSTASADASYTLSAFC